MNAKETIMEVLNAKAKELGFDPIYYKRYPALGLAPLVARAHIEAASESTVMCAYDMQAWALGMSSKTIHNRATAHQTKRR